MNYKNVMEKVIIKYPKTSTKTNRLDKYKKNFNLVQ